MRLVGLDGSRYAVNRLPCSLLRAGVQVQIRNINTRPRHERTPPVSELIELRPRPNFRAQSVAVLGGGITGLATTWHLSRLLPDAKITLYEKQDRLGGWLDSDIVEVDGGKVVFEWGPRSLRPDPAGSGRATIKLMMQLGLQNEIIAISKQSPAALNRFIYYGDRLVKMPGPNPYQPVAFNIVRNLFKILTEPIFKGATSIFAEPWVQPRPSNMADESVGDFISRRFGKPVADNLASAFFHGIYAGDLYKLSARTLLPGLWHMETRDPAGNGVLAEMTDLALRGQGLMMFKHGRYVDLLEAALESDASEYNEGRWELEHGTSVYTLAHGLGSLGQTLQKALEGNRHVSLRPSSDVTELRFNPEKKKTQVITKDGQPALGHDYVVSTLSAGKMLDFARSSATSRGASFDKAAESALESANKAVSVAVVNLYYSNPDLIPSKYRGFGYLIPRTVDLDQNPERGLGVIFGSESSGVRGPDAVTLIPNIQKQRVRDAEQILKADMKDINPEIREGMREMSRKVVEKYKDAVADQPDEVEKTLGQDTAPGTKLTVMLGGHWWDGWSETDLPSPDTCIAMAQSMLQRHLNITEPPTVVKARVNRDCIPQYTVGYRRRMATIHEGLMEEFQGRVKVAGPWWQGAVGVNDCVLNAHLTAFNIREAWDDETGLKEYTEPEKWLIGDKRTHTFVLDRGRDRS